MQRLEIYNFLTLREASVKVSGLTVLIGPQASGKSVIARLFHFFVGYLADMSGPAIAGQEHKSSYDKRKREQFRQIFPDYSWEKEAFRLVYVRDDYFIEISSPKNSSQLLIKTSSSVAHAFQTLKRQYANFFKRATFDLGQTTH